MQLGSLLSNKTFPHDLSSFVIQFHFPVSAEGLKASAGFRGIICAVREGPGSKLDRPIPSQPRSYRAGGPVLWRERGHTPVAVCFFRVSLPRTKSAGPVDRHPGMWVRPDPMETESSCHDHGGLVPAFPHFQWSSFRCDRGCRFGNVRWCDTFFEDDLQHACYSFHKSTA